MASFDNNLRLEEITTGAASGTWGTKTNTNLSLIGKALGYATEASFGSDADTNTTVDNATDSSARAMYFKVTSGVSLTATRTLTILPLTISRVMFIENATSGSQSITIKQGSGATVTIATGKTKVVYLDGAGSGAAVIDALALLENFIATGTAGSLTQLNITSQGDLRLEDSSGGEYAAIQAAGTTTTYTITLPAAVGTSGQVLTLSDGVGATSWSDAGTTSTIADNAVTLAKMATGTPGNLISYDGSNNPVAVGTGTAGQVLTSAGSGNPPAFATPATTTVPYSDWVVKTASDTGMTATSKDQLIINSASAFTLNLPSSPSNGDTVVLSNAGAGTVTVGRNSSNIDSLAEDGTLNSGASVQLVYAGSTIGWHSL
ncbi:MAG: hypothetical protein CMD60_04670 [Gammaproteobacteria bacterium]|nr:hypothetical protein [Gammaproteobacteria bacterium]|tara:strand:- start:27 stop:1151 length:1125 start_codon:yes stop_codon:yes gene_type:complete